MYAMTNSFKDMRGISGNTQSFVMHVQSSCDQMPSTSPIDLTLLVPAMYLMRLACAVACVDLRGLRLFHIVHASIRPPLVLVLMKTGAPSEAEWCSPHVGATTCYHFAVQGHMCRATLLTFGEICPPYLHTAEFRLNSNLCMDMILQHYQHVTIELV